MILNRQRTVRVARPALESFLCRVRSELGLGAADVTICLVSDAEIARMNQSFRKRKGPTDVLSFPSIQTRTQTSAPATVAAADRGGRLFRKNKPPVDPAQAKSALRQSASRQGTASVHPEKRRAVPKQPTKQGASAPEANFLGDIVISPATARRNAKKYGRTLPVELQILTLHGVLHLLGFDHETDRGEMNRIEQRLRRRLGLT